MKKVTLWYKWENKKWNFNHLSDGHDVTIVPNSDDEGVLKNWSKARWAKELVFLNQNKQVVTASGELV